MGTTKSIPGVMTSSEAKGIGSGGDMGYFSRGR